MACVKASENPRSDGRNFEDCAVERAIDLRQGHLTRIIDHDKPVHVARIDRPWDDVRHPQVGYKHRRIECAPEPPMLDLTYARTRSVRLVVVKS